MKNKHHGVTGLIIFGISIASMILYGLFMSSQIKGSIQMERPAVVSSIEVPDAATTSYLQFLDPHLEDLAMLKKNSTSIDLKLFGYTPPKSEKTKSSNNSPNQPVSAQEQFVDFSYSLSLCFASQKGSFCSIGGKLYKEKSTLPDGGKILKIEDDRVLILKQKRKEWIYPIQTRVPST